MLSPVVGVRLNATVKTVPVRLNRFNTCVIFDVRVCVRTRSRLLMTRANIQDIK
jgi:hypothetical protein